MRENRRLHLTDCFHFSHADVCRGVSYTRWFELWYGPSVTGSSSLSLGGIVQREQAAGDAPPASKQKGCDSG